MDASTEELRLAHDAIAELYAERLPEIYARLPVDRAVLDLFCTLVLDVGREIADVRSLPYPDASLAGVVAWYSLMYLAPQNRPRAFGEIARVVRPGGYVVVGYKQGDGSLRRGGRRIGVEFDIYWHSSEEVEKRITDAGFRVVFRGGRPAGELDEQPRGYVIAERE